MNPQLEQLQLKTRRQFLKNCQVGIGALALSSLLGGSGIASSGIAGEETVINPLAPKKPPFAAKAKRVIYLHLTGSPPHLDLYDYKPELVKHDGEPCPDRFSRGSGSRSPPARRICLARRESSPSTAKRASGCPTPFRTCTTWPTNCASSSR